jgi:hypothetical protein
VSLLSSSQAQDVKIGNDAGWAIEFYGVDGWKIGDSPALTLRSSDYYASIEASLSDDFNGGNYSFTIEGLTDADYKSIAKGDSGSRPIAAKLYLFWNDAISSPAAYLKNLIGISGSPSSSDLKDALVSVLYVSQAKRKLGTLTYDTEIHAQEWAFYATNQPLVTPLQADTYPKVATEITNRTKVNINTYPAGAERLTTDAAGTPGGEKVAYGTGTTYAGILNGIASATEKNLNKFGRHMTLIRDGEIHLGPRSFPLNSDPTKDLTVATGLLEASVDGSADQDPTAPDPSGGSQRRHFTLTLKGRPDIKPGDVVRFDAAPEDDSATTPGLGSALLGALAGPLLPAIDGALSSKPPVSLAVTSVKHRMGKATGFSTEVRGVELIDPANPWDSYSDTGASRKPQVASPKADAGAKAADAIMNYVDSWGSGQFTFDVGQVRRFTSQSSGDKTPSQTEMVWEGLQEVDRNPNGTRRLPVDQRNAARMDIPYATSFAWGKCGLVVPRYPGMRVVLAHRRGMEQEPVDVGAIWDSGTGPDTKPGDWWLSLPVGVDESKRDSAADSETPESWSAAVSQDLIDADGNRMIELGSLVVRVGKDDLSNAGTRPELPDDAGSISIEHVKGGSKIVMKQDGSIAIQGSAITLDAGDGDITIKANNVNVNVSTAMNVK